MRRLFSVLFLLLVATPSAMAGKQFGETATYMRKQSFTLILTYVAAGNGVGQVECVCAAEPGTTDATAKWQIKKLIYDVNNAVTDVQWADGNDLYDNVCTSPASLTFS